MEPTLSELSVNFIFFGSRLIDKLKIMVVYTSILPG